VPTLSESCAACGSPLSAETSIHGYDRLHGVPGAFEVRVCSVCGSGRTFPLVPTDELASFYPASYSAYAAPRGSFAGLLVAAQVRRRYRSMLGRHPFSALRRLPAGRLLDVGAGSGDLGLALEPRGWRVIGLEPSADGCRRGRSRGLEMVEGTLETVDASDLGSGYDAVVFQHSLEHVVDPGEDLARARGLLRDGGLLIVSLPNFGSWQRRTFGSAWFHLDLPRHRTHFTADGLKRLLRDNGFADCELTTSTTTDGLPMSLQYRTFGRRRFRSGAGLYVAALVSIALLPASLLLSAVRGGGDELGASAVRTETSAPPG
jgi:2-polyprenyl-3-methyl-5-hydroxy-6-metoxy-1,4-benzoquinol methylase